MPAACGKPSKVRLRRRLVGKVERLRVVFARKFQNFLARDRVTAELGLRADLKVFEVDQRSDIAAGPAWRE